MSKEQKYKLGGGIWQSIPWGANPLYKSAAVMEKAQPKLKAQKNKKQSIF